MEEKCSTNAGHDDEWFVKNTYKCSSCENEVDGFHDCKKIISEEIKACGCKIVIKEGFDTLTSCCRGQFEYTYPCAEHKSKRKTKLNSKKRARKNFKKESKPQSLLLGEWF